MRRNQQTCWWKLTHLRVPALGSGGNVELTGSRGRREKKAGALEVGSWQSISDKRIPVHDQECDSERRGFARRSLAQLDALVRRRRDVDQVRQKRGLEITLLRT